MTELGKKQILIRPVKNKAKESSSDDLLNKIASCVKVMIDGPWDEIKLANEDTLMDFKKAHRATLVVNLKPLLGHLGYEYINGVKWKVNT
jgi:hypothetical protein